MTMFADTILPRREGTALTRWGLAALVVVLAHIGLLIAFLLVPHSDMPPGQPPDAVMINLAPVEVAPPPQEEVDTPPQPDEVQPATPPEPTPPPLLPLQTITQAPISPDVLPAPQAEAQMAPPPPPPPKIVPKPVEKKLPPKPVKREKQEAKPKAAVKSTRSDLPRSERAAAPRAGVNGASVASWKSEIVMRINSVKGYPAGAGASGTAVVAFSVTRGGAVVGARLVRSSGSSALDQAAVATVRRANPVPPPPAGVNGGSFTIPLHFSRG